MRRRKTVSVIILMKSAKINDFISWKERYKMKIQILSDLHLEFLSPSQVDRIVGKIECVGDVLVLAGDVGNGMASYYHKFIEKMAAKFTKVFVVAGNHEYYGNDIEITNQKIRSVCDCLENVSFLCSTWEDYGGLRWIGTTLWSHVLETTRCFTNDIRYIQNMPISKYNQHHHEAVQFLSEALEISKDKPCVVMTHYLPSMELIHKKYRSKENEPYNQWFASSLDSLIQTHTHHVPLWFYGHTHDPSHRKLFDTEMVCNPIGYEGENKHPNWNFVVELDHSSVSSS